MPADPDVILRLRPLRSDVPADVRLRRALKALLRVYRYRCVLVQPVARVDLTPVPPPRLAPELGEGVIVVQRPADCDPDL